MITLRVTNFEQSKKYVAGLTAIIYNAALWSDFYQSHSRRLYEVKVHGTDQETRGSVYQQRAGQPCGGLLSVDQSGLGGILSADHSRPLGD